MRRYKSAEERCIHVPFSIPVRLINDFEIAASKLDLNRSELIQFLIKYFLRNKQDKIFLRKLKDENN